MCVIFQLFYSVTVDSFWQFRINSFLGCAQEEGGGRYPVSTWHGWLPRDEVYSVYSAVYSAGQCHMASCLSHQKTAQFDWYLLSELSSARARHTSDGHQWLGRGSQLTPSTANQIRYNTGYALWKKNGAFKEIFYHHLIILVICVAMWHFIYIF